MYSGRRVDLSGDSPAGGTPVGGTQATQTRRFTRRQGAARSTSESRGTNFRFENEARWVLPAHGGLSDTHRFVVRWEAIHTMSIEARDREQREFAAIPASARAARTFVSSILRAGGATAGVISDYELVVSELTANLIEHGDGSELTVTIDVADEQWWEVAVVGTTAAVGVPMMVAPATWTLAGPFEPSGRGLGIVRQLMDQVDAVSTGGHVTIRCRRRRSPEV